MACVHRHSRHQMNCIRFTDTDHFLSLLTINWFYFSQMVLPQNMAEILALANLKEQLKLNSTSGTDLSPCVTITPSRLSPSLNAENSNNSNSGICQIFLFTPRLYIA